MPNVIFCDSFDHYVMADLLKKYPYATVFGGYGDLGPGFGRYGTGGMKMNWGAAYVSLQYRPPTPLSGVYVEFAMKPGALAAEPFILLYDSAGTLHCELRLTVTGELQVTRNGTQVAITTGLGLAPNNWYHIGFHATIADAGGEYEVRVDGVNVLSGSGDTRNAGTAEVGRIRLTSASSSSLTYFDDLIISTDGFCGDCRVKALFPAGAGNYSDWTASAGSGYQCVDEASMNSDTDYVSSSTAAQRNSYDFGAVGITGTVKAVQHVTTLRKDDAGARTVQQSVRIGSTDYDTSDITVTDGYLMQTRIMPTKPSDASAWTVSDIDAAEFGTELVS